MKKISISLIVFVCIFASIGLFNSCASKPVEKKVELLEPVVIESSESVSESGNVVFTNLPHVELINLLCRLAGLPSFQYIYNGDNAYLSQMMTLLEKYKDYAVIKRIQDFSKRGVSDDAFLSLAYHIRSDFTGTTVSMDPKPDTLNKAWKDIPSSEIYAFVKEIHDFAITSNYSRIYLLNRGTFVADCLYTQENFKKYKLEEWMNDFFGGSEPEKLYVNISMSNVGFNAYDISTNENNEPENHLSIFRGCNLQYVGHTYINLKLQSYMDENWETVKESYSKWFEGILIKYAGDDKEALKRAKEYNVTEKELSQTISELIALFYLDEVLSEVEEQYGIKDEGYSIASKIYGEEVTKQIFDLIQNYLDNRETYPEFKLYYPQITQMIMNLPQS